jgi:hypothetical protein
VPTLPAAFGSFAVPADAPQGSPRTAARDAFFAALPDARRVFTAAPHGVSADPLYRWHGQEDRAHAHSGVCWQAAADLAFADGSDPRDLWPATRGPRLKTPRPLR